MGFLSREVKKDRRGGKISLSGSKKDRRGGIKGSG